MASFSLFFVHVEGYWCTWSDTSHSVGLLWKSDRSSHRDLYLTTHNIHKTKKSMAPAGFEPTIPASAQPQRSAGDFVSSRTNILCTYNFYQSSPHPPRWATIPTRCWIYEHNFTGGRRFRSRSPSVVYSYSLSLWSLRRRSKQTFIHTERQPFTHACSAEYMITTNESSDSFTTSFLS